MTDPGRFNLANLLRVIRMSDQIDDGGVLDVALSRMHIWGEPWEAIPVDELSEADVQELWDLVWAISERSPTLREVMRNMGRDA